MKVLAYSKYGRLAASTRQRLLQYAPALAGAGIELDHRPLLDDDYVSSLATGATYPRRRILKSYLDRIAYLLRRADADLIWVYAELFPYLPAGFERLVSSAGLPIIYDFDDAFFHQYDDNNRALVRRMLGGKLRPLIARAAACTCGNDYLRRYAAHLCERSLIFPTVVDTEAYQPTPPRADAGVPTIGWIGSPSTWAYVRPLLPMLAQLAAAGSARVLAVGAGTRALADRFPGMELVDWSEDREIAEVKRMDIGIMPVPDEPWARGKSGYKLIQYGACGLPVVASPVGVNSEIVENGRTGLLVRSPEEWRKSLDRLLASPDLRQRMGAAGRERIVDHYSLAVHAPRLVDLFRSVAARGRP
jgi:glycosyltransferase involved in cell wall biosynthesis